MVLASYLALIGKFMVVLINTLVKRLDWHLTIAPFAALSAFVLLVISQFKGTQKNYTPISRS